MRVFTDTATIVDRRDVFADARIALDRMSKQFRQGETIDTAASDCGAGDDDHLHRRSADHGGVAGRRRHRLRSQLQESRDGGTTFNTVLSSLGSADVFTYTVHEDVTDQITVELTLKTTDQFGRLSPPTST